MASNSWNETIADVNKTLANMNQAISDANGAAELARTETAETSAQGDAAAEAAAAANEAAEIANAEAEKWRNCTVSALTLPSGSDATVSVSEKDGAKHITVGIPRGSDGATGAKGDMGESGVTFSRSGTTLHINTY